jgi:hypothetical protein
MKAIEPGLPVEPIKDTAVEAGLIGLDTTAKLLGTFRRQLRTEGFTKRETFELCDLWLTETLGACQETED